MENTDAVESSTGGLNFPSEPELSQQACTGLGDGVLLEVLLPKYDIKPHFLPLIVIN